MALRTLLMCKSKPVALSEEYTNEEKQFQQKEAPFKIIILGVL